MVSLPTRICPRPVTQIRNETCGTDRRRRQNDRQCGTNVTTVTIRPSNHYAPIGNQGCEFRPTFEDRVPGEYRPVSKSGPMESLAA